MSTLWKWRLFIVAHVDGNTADNRTAFAEAFANNGSGQTVAQEREMFNQAAKVALSATPTVHRAFMLSTPVKASMRDALLDVITQIDSGLTPAKKTVWFGVANVDGAMWQGNPYNEGECFVTSDDVTYAALLGNDLPQSLILSTLGIVVMDESP